MNSGSVKDRSWQAVIVVSLSLVPRMWSKKES